MKSVMFVRGLLAIMLLLALGALSGCGDNEQTQGKPAAVTKEDVKNKAKEAYDTTKTYTQEQMQAFRQQTEAKLAEYEKDIDRFIHILPVIAIVMVPLRVIQGCYSHCLKK